MFYIDESGSIPKHYSTKHGLRYFVIAFVHTDNPTRLKRVYRNALRDLRKHFPTFFQALKDPSEMKGSEAYPFMKMYILEKLVKLTDIKIGHMIVDNWIIEDSFRVQSNRSFNYLVKIILENFKLSSLDKEHLILRVDNRNSTVQSLNSLEDYLFQELVLGRKITKNVSVHYLESCNDFGIQVADVVSNALFQAYKYEGMPFPDFKHIKKEDRWIYQETYRRVIDVIRPYITTGFTYPPYSSEAHAAATLHRRQGTLGQEKQ